jgi:hypothetical protein
LHAKKIISGGQTGVDRGALDASLEMHFSCGGWCPKDGVQKMAGLTTNIRLKKQKILIMTPVPD